MLIQYPGAPLGASFTDSEHLCAAGFLGFYWETVFYPTATMVSYENP